MEKSIEFDDLSYKYIASYILRYDSMNDMLGTIEHMSEHIRVRIE